MAQVSVNNGSGVHFTPKPYPTTGTVTAGTTVTFSAGGTCLTFYAQAGLFYLSGSSGDTNSGTTLFTAPPSANNPLTLYVAATTAGSYTLSLNTVTAEFTAGPNDGQINVGSGSDGEDE